MPHGTNQNFVTPAQTAINAPLLALEPRGPLLLNLGGVSSPSRALEDVLALLVEKLVDHIGSGQNFTHHRFSTEATKPMAHKPT